MWSCGIRDKVKLSMKDHDYHEFSVAEHLLKFSQAYYVVMQKCGGGELFDFLLNETDVPERECKRIMREILKAVDHLHSKGLVHRDIKPENVGPLRGKNCRKSLFLEFFLLRGQTVRHRQSAPDCPRRRTAGGE